MAGLESDTHQMLYTAQRSSFTFSRNMKCKTQEDVGTSGPLLDFSTVLCPPSPAVPFVRAIDRRLCKKGRRKKARNDEVIASQETEWRRGRKTAVNLQSIFQCFYVNFIIFVFTLATTRPRVGRRYPLEIVDCFQSKQAIPTGAPLICLSQ